MIIVGMELKHLSSNTKNVSKWLRRPRVITNKPQDLIPDSMGPVKSSVFLLAFVSDTTKRESEKALFEV